MFNPKISIIAETDKSVTIQAKGFMGTSTMEIPLTKEKFTVCYNRWQAGEMIQTAFRMLNADQREFILSGITPNQWNEITQEQEEEEEV